MNNSEEYSDQIKAPRPEGFAEHANLTDEEKALVVMWLRKYARTQYENMNFAFEENGRNEDMMQTMDRIIDKLLAQIPKDNLVRMLLEG